MNNTSKTLSPRQFDELLEKLESSEKDELAARRRDKWLKRKRAWQR